MDVQRVMWDGLDGLLPTIKRVFGDVAAFLTRLVSAVVATIREVAPQIASYVSDVAGKIVNVVAVVASDVVHLILVIAAVIFLTSLIIVCLGWLGKGKRRAPILPVHRGHTAATYSLNHQRTYISVPSVVNWVSEREAVHVEVPSPAPRLPPAPQVKTHPSQKSSYGATHEDSSTTSPLQRYAPVANRASTDLPGPKAAGPSNEGIYEPDANEFDHPDAYCALLRARAIAARDAMDNALEERRVARGAGNRARAKALSNLVKAKQAEMERLNDEASQLIFSLNNADRDPGEVDLHDLYVKEAVKQASQSIETARQRGDLQLRLIVGKGRHSVDGVAKLRPAIEQLVKKRNLVAAFDPGNAGVLVVQLNGKAGRGGIRFETAGKL